mmetsp:Transcript_21032/g.34714  ORF Transcript_21032/g.34714 Transcript_21032/m.34714 type:complete len:266 (+) Transcript_21032:1628-2425(+)
MVKALSRPRRSPLPSRLWQPLGIRWVSQACNMLGSSCRRDKCHKHSSQPILLLGSVSSSNSSSTSNLVSNSFSKSNRLSLSRSKVCQLVLFQGNKYGCRTFLAVDPILRSRPLHSSGHRRLHRPQESRPTIKPAPSLRLLLQPQCQALFLIWARLWRHHGILLVCQACSMESPSTLYSNLPHRSRFPWGPLPIHRPLRLLSRLLSLPPMRQTPLPRLLTLIPRLFNLSKSTLASKYGCRTCLDSIRPGGRTNQGSRHLRPPLPLA